MKKATVLTEGAIMAAIFIVLLFLFNFIPIVGGVAYFLLPLPFVLYHIRFAIKPSLLLMVVCSIATIIFYSIFSLPFPLMMGAVGIVIGELIKKKRSRIQIFLQTMVAYVISLVGIFIISKLVFQIDFVAETQTLLNEAMIQAQTIFKEIGQEVPTEQFEGFKNLLAFLPVILPIIFVVTSAMMSFFTLALCSPVLKRLGYQIEAWPTPKNLSLPKQFVWIYLLVILGSFLPINTGSISYTIIINLLFLLQLLAIFQGITLIFTYFNAKKVAKGMQILFVVLLFFIPVLFSVVMLLGIIDLGFSLRNRI